MGYWPDNIQHPDWSDAYSQSAAWVGATPKLSQLPEEQDTQEYILASGALTLKDTVVHLGCCEHQLNYTIPLTLVSWEESSVRLRAHLTRYVSKFKYFWYDRCSVHQLAGVHAPIYISMKDWSITEGWLHCSLALWGEAGRPIQRTQDQMHQNWLVPNWRPRLAAFGPSADPMNE